MQPCYQADNYYHYLLLKFTAVQCSGPHGMEEGKGERYLAPGRQYGNALLGVCHQEEEVQWHYSFSSTL